MPRLFAPPGFEATKVAPDLYQFLLEAFNDETCVLLEFHSPGPQQRQIDLAVLGPYGVDVVEVKAKTGGAVIAQSNGPWLIRRDDGTSETMALNSAAQENPYDQVLNTSDDFRRWLASELSIDTKVFPQVLVPHFRREHNLRNRGFVWATNGLERFRPSLRSLRPYRDLPVSLTPELEQRIVERLGLTPLDTTYVTSPPTAPKAESSTPQAVTLQAPALTLPRAHRPDALPEKVKRSSSRQTRWLTLTLSLVGVFAVGWGWSLFSEPPTVVPSHSETFTTKATVTPLTPGAEPSLPGVAYQAVSHEVVDDEAAPVGSSCPLSHPLKGNINAEGEHIFHSQGQAYYDLTTPEACFATESAAVAAGFRASLR